MPKSNARLEAARMAYREALEAARANPSAEAWARLLAAGKELSSAQEPKGKRSPRRQRPRALAPEGAGLADPEASERLPVNESIDLDSTMD